MSMAVTVEVRQMDTTASEGSVRGHRVMMDRPTEKEGQDKGAMGGEVLLMALGGCFMSNLLAAIRSREAAISDVLTTITGTLESAPPRFSAIEMKISATYDDQPLMEKIVTIAERGCINANTLKNAVELKIVVE